MFKAFFLKKNSAENARKIWVNKREVWKAVSLVVGNVWFFLFVKGSIVLKKYVREKTNYIQTKLKRKECKSCIGKDRFSNQRDFK